MRSATLKLHFLDLITGRLILVDLAGSERTAFTGATGHVLNQSIAINKSLFTLRKVIATLAAAATKGFKLSVKGYVCVVDGQMYL